LAALQAQEEKELAKLKKASAAEKKTLAPVVSLSARNIDDAIDLMVVATASTTSTAAAAAAVERHPERRAKAAYLAYEERELPRLKEEHKGLRLTQLKQILWKNWQKSPENPFNQAALAYNSTQQEVMDQMDRHRKDIEERLMDEE
jgi:ribosomal protein L12E/L44/L45/RPP1/RPP2